jgi:dephospho-CoA kinase
VDLFKRLIPECVVFDADVCVQTLYSDQKVLQELTCFFGNHVITDTGAVDKATIRQRVFSDNSAKAALEKIFHPRVRKECLALLGETVKKNASRLFVADIPLLFENGFDFGQSANLLVATSGQTQIERLKNRNAWSDKTAQAVISAQMPLENKMLLTDIVFWNEGPVGILKNQCQRYLQSQGLIR